MENKGSFMQQWTVIAKNAVNGAKIQEKVTGESFEQAKELFLAGRPGMSLEIIDVVPDTVAAVPSAEKKCPKCAEMVKVEAQVCRFCKYEFVAQNHGYSQREDRGSDAAVRLLRVEAKKKSAGVAALLNLLLAGAGYVYCGRPVLGLLAFFVTVMVTIFTAGFGWFAMAFILVIDGILSANRYNQKLLEDAIG